MEVCSLPALLSPGIDYLERTVLPSSALDADHAPLWGDALPLPCLPLQFRQFPSVQGKARLEEFRSRAHPRRTAAGKQPSAQLAQLAGDELPDLRL